jgi:hypothetical protein
MDVIDGSVDAAVERSTIVASHEVIDQVISRKLAALR